MRFCSGFDEKFWVNTKERIPRFHEVRVSGKVRIRDKFKVNLKVRVSNIKGLLGLQKIAYYKMWRS